MQWQKEHWGGSQGIWLQVLLVEDLQCDLGQVATSLELSFYNPIHWAFTENLVCAGHGAPLWLRQTLSYLLALKKLIIKLGG